MKENNTDILIEEGKVFFDTNILIYFVDEKDPRKQIIAKDLIERAVQNHNGMLSTQSLQEFYNVITSKLKCPKDKAKKLHRQNTNLTAVSSRFNIVCIQTILKFGV